MNFFLLKSLLVIACGLVSLSAAAFPNKPVSIVVPYAAGGSTDVMARVLAEAMARELGQAVVVENLGGPVAPSARPRWPGPRTTVTPYCSTTWASRSPPRCIAS